MEITPKILAALFLGSFLLGYQPALHSMQNTVTSQQKQAQTITVETAIGYLEKRMEDIAEMSQLSQEEQQIADAHLFVAIEDGNFALLKTAIEADANFNSIRNQEEKFRVEARSVVMKHAGTSLPFHYALPEKDQEILQQILQLTANVRLAQEVSWNIMNGGGDVAKVRAALKAGADVNGLMKEYEGFTFPLISATSHGYTDVIDILLAQGAHVNAKNYLGQTALMMAIKRSDVKTIKKLIQAKALPDIQDNSGNTALIHAIESESYYTVAHEKQRYENGVTSELNKYNIPELSSIIATYSAPSLDEFAEIQEYEKNKVVKILLKADSNVNVKPLNWHTPLIVATIKQYVNIIKTLLAAGADISITTNFAENRSFDWPFTVDDFAKINQWDDAEDQIKKEAIQKLLAFHKRRLELEQQTATLFSCQEQEYKTQKRALLYLQKALRDYFNKTGRKIESMKDVSSLIGQYFFNERKS